MVTGQKSPLVGLCLLLACAEPSATALRGHSTVSNPPKISLVLGNIFTFGPLNYEKAEPTSNISARPAAIPSHPAPLPLGYLGSSTLWKSGVPSLELPVTWQLDEGI